ncbi:MAG: alpha amylase [Clostridia bacterium]|nr:alpha amylase [Clostridia bacterium]
MKHLNLLLNALENSRDDAISIPESWNTCGCPSLAVSPGQGEIKVSSKQFFIRSVNNILSRQAVGLSDSLSCSVVYSMLPSVHTAWDHHGNGICGGTFLKCIAVLPLLKRMNVDIVYLLPVFEGSELFRKGEKSSPYSIKDYLRIDPSLHDEHLPGITADEEFCAFVEACHHMGMRVMMDFVFRTCARDSVLLTEHPDWFYWIKADRADSIAAPGVDGLGHCSVDKKNVSLLYRSADMPAFIDNFVSPPTNEQWSGIISGCGGDSSRALCDITDRYGMCTMTGFADTINDPQPPWTDVTYLKYYFDNSPYAAQLGDDLPPFIAQDGIKCSLFPGNEPNHTLWEYIKGIIPHYIKMGIDGARIDMGHALPTQLNKAITETAKAMKPDFFFWSEQFDPANAESAKNEGASFITGDMLFMWKDRTTCRRSFGVRRCTEAPLPFTACCETADTPRASILLKSIKNVKAAVFLCALLPNSLFFINSGLELDEIQPMNLGLMNDESGRYVLDKSHPMYGKLAFFDNVAFDWRRLGAAKGYKWIGEAAAIRKKYSELICTDNLDKSLFFRRDALQILRYSDPGRMLTVFLNQSARSIDLGKRLSDRKYTGFGLPEVPDGYVLERGDVCIFEQ